MSFSLIIIDMQHYFIASRGKPVQQACLREIKKAIRDRAPIIFVEYELCGPTLPILTKAVVNYKRSYVVTKDDMDGSYQVVDFLTRWSLSKMNLRIAGVNSDACVIETVEGLTAKLPNSHIHVVADACATDNGMDGHRQGLSDMKALPNVKLLRARKWIK